MLSMSAWLPAVAGDNEDEMLLLPRWSQSEFDNTLYYTADENVVY